MTRSQMTDMTKEQAIRLKSFLLSHLDGLDEFDECILIAGLEKTIQVLEEQHNI